MGLFEFITRRRSTRANRPASTRGRLARFEPLEQRRLLSGSSALESANKELMAGDPR